MTSQSNNLQEFQSATGTVLSLFDSSGNLKLNAQNSIIFADNDSSNYVAFKAATTIASNITWTLPSTDGSTNQSLVTNGSGTLSWATPSAAGSVFTNSGTAPISPTQGDRWYDTNSGNIYTYMCDGNSCQWIK